MENIDLDLLGMTEHFLSFDAFKLKKTYMVMEMASKAIDLEPRPNRMKKPPELQSVTTNPTGYFSDLYIQDEMRYMLIDKYGKEKGERQFDSLLDSPQRGAFFAQGGILAAEKAGLIDVLGKRSNGDYWQFSYYEMWKEWMESINQSINITTPAPVVTAPTTVIAKTPRVTTTSVNNDDVLKTSITLAFQNLSGKGATDAEKNKSKTRIANILNGSNVYGNANKMVNATNEPYKLVQRAYYAIMSNDRNAVDVAKIFWNKAVSLGVRESMGVWFGLDVIHENVNTVGEDTWNYFLCDDGGCSTEWDLPIKLEIGTIFTHSFGKFKVSSYDGDKNISCDKI